MQIGDPITEKGLIELVEAARDQRLYNAITDCGAGGLSSAVGEMGEKLGADVELQDVPLKYPGLTPWEIWLSEAQERMVLAVRPATSRVSGHWQTSGMSRCAIWATSAVTAGCACATAAAP